MMTMVWPRRYGVTNAQEEVETEKDSKKWSCVRLHHELKFDEISSRKEMAHDLCEKPQ